MSCGFGLSCYLSLKITQECMEQVACEAGDNVHAVKKFCEWRKPRQRALVVVAIATLGGTAASTFTIVRTVLPENTVSYTVHGTGNRYLICTKFCVERDVNGS